ncbi:MAG: RNHCP domain-containing protein [Tepidisphaeraceae bacterium]
MSDHRRHRGSSDGFVCRHCGRGVNPCPYGSEHRNHCPWCLWSLHVDERPGDRASACRGKMEPIAVWVRRDGEWAVVHRCGSCGCLKSNRIAADDEPWALMSLAAHAIARPPFPLDVK